MKLLEKTLKDAIKEKNCVIGTKKILSSMINIKMVVISQSVTTENIKKIEENVQNEKIPMVHFKGTSVALGKLCGLPFRVSTISLKSLNDTNIQSILKESEERWRLIKKFYLGLNEREKYSSYITLTLTIKLSSDQIRLMSLFQNVTKTNAHDCIDDVKKDRIIFVVNEGKMGLAIGKGGSNIKNLQNILKRNVELVEYCEEPIKFLKNILNPKLVNEVQLSDRSDGSKQATVVVDPSKKGLVVGREGRNAEKARLLSKRYFNITNILIHSHTPQLEI